MASIEFNADTPTVMGLLSPVPLLLHQGHHHKRNNKGKMQFMPHKCVACFRRTRRASQSRPSHFSAFLDSPIRRAARGMKCKCGIKMRSSSNTLSSLSLPMMKLSHAFSDNLSLRALSNFSQSFSDCLSLRLAFSVQVSVDAILSTKLTLFDARVGLKRF